MIVFSCSNSAILSKKISNKIGCRLLKFNVKKFPNNELKVFIDDFFSDDYDEILNAQELKNQELKNQELNFQKLNGKKLNVKKLNGKKLDTAIIVSSMNKNANDSLMELLFIIDFIKNMGFLNIIVVIPYFYYCRQNIDFGSSNFSYEAFPLNTAIKLIESVGANYIITVNIHSENSKKLFKIKCENLDLSDLFADAIEKYCASYKLKNGKIIQESIYKNINIVNKNIVDPIDNKNIIDPIDNKNIIDPIDDFIFNNVLNNDSGNVFNNVSNDILQKIVIVSPDKGGKKRAEKLAKKMNKDLLIMNKNRKNNYCIGEKKVNYTTIDSIYSNMDNKKINLSEIDLRGYLNNKNFIIVDDIIDSGYTLCKAAQYLVDNGANLVFACISHGIFSGNCLEKLKNAYLKKIIHKIFTTNSICNDVIIKNEEDFIYVLSIDEIICNALNKF